MFKWDKLLRKNKLTMNIDDVQNAAGEHDTDDFSETDGSQENIDTEYNEHEIVEIEILPAKIICPDCGGITLEGLEFCDKCGGEL